MGEGLPGPGVGTLSDSGTPPSPPHPRQLREPQGVKSSWWQQWLRRRQIAGQRLGEAARQLAQGCGLWEGALYEIGGRNCTPSPRPASPLHSLSVHFRNQERASSPFATAPLRPHQPPAHPQTLMGEGTPGGC